MALFEIADAAPTPARDLWESTARDVVLNSLQRARRADRKFANKIHRGLHALLDQGTGALELIEQRMRVTHPTVAKDWAKDHNGARLFGFVQMIVQSLATIFHAPPETYLTRNGQRLPEDDPEVQQWRADSIDLAGTLSQLDRWAVLFRTVLCQPAWVGGRMKWLLFPPYQVSHVETSQIDPTEIGTADWVTVELAQRWNKPSTFVTWTPDAMFHHSESGQLYDNTLFADDVNGYGLIPFSVWRASSPAPGEFWDEPRFGWYQHELACSLSLSDLDHILKFQSFGVPVLSGWHEQSQPQIGPGRAITTHEAPADFSFDWVTPGSPANVKVLMEAIENQLRLAAVAEGLPADIWSALGAARSALAKKVEAHQLTLRRQERIPSYLAAMRRTWQIHKEVSNFHYQAGRVRYSPETELEVVFAPVPFPVDETQLAQTNDLLFRQGILSPVDVVMRRENMTREQATARVIGNLQAGKVPTEEGGVPAIEYTGIQIQSAINIIAQVKEGAIERAAGIAMLQAFLGLTKEQAAAMVGG